MKVNIYKDFPTNYDLDPLHELSPREDCYYFPGGTSIGGKDGLLLKVHPFHGNNWVGIFAFGYPPPTAKTGIYTYPDPDKLCVVSRGKGYIVQVDNPVVWEEIQPFPIIDVHPVPGLDMIIFAGFTRLTAYRREGRAWKTKELSWDGIKITAITSKSLQVVGWDAPENKESTFYINMQDGTFEGDSIPPTPET
jgi:hypothetical protein